MEIQGARIAMITTVQQHIQQQQEMLRSTGGEASGAFSWLLSGITLAAKMVEARQKVDVYEHAGGMATNGVER